VVKPKEVLLKTRQDLQASEASRKALTTERDKAQDALTSQVQLIRQANEARFIRLRELHSQEITAIVTAYEQSEG
jgi:hypothetical protein